MYSLEVLLENYVATAFNIVPGNLQTGRAVTLYLWYHRRGVFLRACVLYIWFSKQAASTGKMYRKVWVLELDSRVR